jgi:hypothetical protein
MRIAIHTHILAMTWPDLRERCGNGGWIRLESLQERDRDAVDIPVLSPVPVIFVYRAKPKGTLDLCQILHDDIQEHIESYPNRIAGLASLPMQRPAFH